MYYVLIFLWLGICAFLSKSIVLKRSETISGVEVERYSVLFAVVLIMPLVIFAGLRTKAFGDTAAYIQSYNSLPTDFSELQNKLSSNVKDAGFVVLSFVLKNIFGDSVKLYLLTFSFIQGIIISLFYRKYSTSFIFSVFLFVASTDYIAWMFNGVRQFLAVTIIIAATPFLIRKKYVPYILVVLLAATMHQSALLVIPIAFIVQGKVWNKKTLLFVALVLLSIVFLNEFTSLLNDSLQNTQYANVVNDYKEISDDGTNPLRVIFYSLPTIVSFFARKTINQANNKIINICVNMSIVSSALYLVSMFTSGIYIGRLPIYFSLFNYILIPWEIKHLVSDKYRNLVKVAVIVIYLLFFYYQMHFSWRFI